jgi:hypothetical protein
VEVRDQVVSGEVPKVQDLNMKFSAGETLAGSTISGQGTSSKKLYFV